ncbi:MAG: GNAT family N-acetyltransferase [Armatimonadota bacterium]
MQLTVRELSAEEYPLWDQLLATSPQRSIFAQRWWMDIVTQGGVTLMGCFSSTRLLAGLPIWPCTTLGVKRLRQPPLTPYWGPLFLPGDPKAKYITRLTDEMAILEAFAEVLQPWPDITMTFHPSLTNWLPFHWHGFQQTTRYTYRVNNHLTDWKLFEQGCNHTTRIALRKARESGLLIRDMVDPQVVLNLTRLSMQRNGLDSATEIINFWPALTAAALERNCMCNMAIADTQENIHSASSIVWDDRCTYGILGGGDPKYRRSSAGALGMWHEVEKAAELGTQYDFEGSMLKPVEYHFRSFGGEQYPYLLVTRSASPRLNMARRLQQGLTIVKEWTTDRLRKPSSPPATQGEKAGGN